jgi:hypothetical protein
MSGEWQVSEGTYIVSGMKSGSCIQQPSDHLHVPSQSGQVQRGPAELQQQPCAALQFCSCCPSVLHSLP